jgi:hypothetical protein
MTGFAAAHFIRVQSCSGGQCLPTTAVKGHHFHFELTLSSFAVMLKFEFDLTRPTFVYCFDLANKKSIADDFHCSLRSRLRNHSVSALPERGRAPASLSLLLCSRDLVNARPLPACLALGGETLCRDSCVAQPKARPGFSTWQRIRLLATSPRSPQAQGNRR